MKIETRIENFTIRTAEATDCKLILNFIKELAEYEKLLHEVEASEQTLKDSLFSEKPFAKVIIGEFENTPVGYALYFNNFSTFTGRPGIYLEDLFVPEQHRGQGIGKLLLATLAKIAVERDCPRLEWSVLDWNQPAIDFYESLGTTVMRDWLPCRIDDINLSEIALQGTTVSKR